MASFQRAFTVIVSGPNHLIGDNQQLAKYREGKTSELPPWYAEWSDMLPHWHLAILESPADVGQFYRGAQRDPRTPRVGFIANSKLSLSCGYEGGFERHDTPRAYGRDRALPESAAEIEKELLTRIRKARNKTRSTQAEAEAQVAEGETENTTELPTRTFPVGVSERTERRDMLLRQASVTRFQDEQGQWRAAIHAQPIPRCGTQLCLQIATRGPAQIIYAAPHSGIAPMPCGAYVWLVCPSGVDVVPASAQEDAGVLLPTASAIPAL